VTGKSEILSARFTKAERDQVDRWARARKCTRADLTRFVLLAALRARREARAARTLSPTERRVFDALDPSARGRYLARRATRKGSSMSAQEAVPRADVVAALLAVFKIDPSAADAADQLLDAVEGLPAKDAPAALRAVLAAVGVEVPNASR